jgi:ParB/RepB/Spo0J family partition protein
MSKTKKPAPKTKPNSKPKAQILKLDASEHVGGKFIAIDLKLIDPSKTNPRKHFDEVALKDLAESIAKRGVLSPILVRPVGKRYELVAGERRFRAAKIAGLKEVTARVASLDDKAVLEVQVIENLQRTDLSPIEEAESYAKLVKSHGYTVEVLAAKIGKSQSYVHKRMKLAGLPKVAKDAVAAGALPIAHAILLARIPEENLQLQAFKAFKNYGEGFRSLKECYRTVTEQFMLQLSKAPFDIKSLTVLPAAGACTTCEFKTGNQKDLFDDIKGGDICTKPSCYAEKVESWWKSSETKEKKLPASDTAKLFPYEHQPRSLRGDTYIDLADKCYDATGSATYGTLVGKEVEVFLVLDREGGVHRVAKRSEVLPRVKNHPSVKAARANSGDAKYRRQQQKRKEERDVRRAVNRKLNEQFAGAWITHAHSIDFGTQLPILLKGMLLRDSWKYDDHLKSRGLVGLTFENREKKIVEWIDSFSIEIEAWLEFFSVLIFLFSDPQDTDEHHVAVYRSILEMVHIDHRAIESEVLKELAEKAKAKKSVKPKPKRKAAKAKPTPVAESEDDFEEVDEEITELEEVEE